MSIGNLKDSGNQGNNFPWQLKMLLGQECACDALNTLVTNTDTVEPLLAQILAAIQAGTDYEAALVEDGDGTTWLEVRIWNTITQTFDPPVYFAAGTNVPGTPSFPITYINPNTYLAQIVSYTASLPLIYSTVNNIEILATNVDTNVTNIESYLAPITRTHNTVSTSAVGFVPAGSIRGSVMNVGNAAGIWNGIALPAGVTIPWGTVGVSDPYNQINFNATGTTFIIEYTT